MADFGGARKGGSVSGRYTSVISSWQVVMVMLQLRQLVVQPGQRIQLQDVVWSEFEAILDELGDKRACRIAYQKFGLKTPSF